jgi:hypothetical protein
LLHAAPVLERLGHQAPGRDRNNCLVEGSHPFIEQKTDRRKPFKSVCYGFQSCPFFSRRMDSLS